MNNKNKRNRNKKNKAAKKAEDSDGDWEELLKAPLPNDESTADMTHASAAEETKTADKDKKQMANDEDWEDDDDETRATNDSTKANARQSRADDDDGGEDGAGKKKRKKRANKRTVAKLKELRRNFMDRCVSPNYSRVSRLQLNGEICLTNLKQYFCSLPDAPYMNTRSKTGAAGAEATQQPQPDMGLNAMDLGWFMPEVLPGMTMPMAPINPQPQPPQMVP